MAKVFVKVFGADSVKEVEANTVGALKTSQGLVGYSAKVNGIDADDSVELQADDVVRFTKEVKGGRLVATFRVK